MSASFDRVREYLKAVRHLANNKEWDRPHYPLAFLKLISYAAGHAYQQEGNEFNTWANDIIAKFVKDGNLDVVALFLFLRQEENLVELDSGSSPE